MAYLLTAERYGAGLYQEEPSILAPGCLEALTGAIAGRIAAIANADPANRMTAAGTRVSPAGIEILDLEPLFQVRNVTRAPSSPPRPARRRNRGPGY